MDGKLKNDLCSWHWWLTLLANWALVPFALLTWRGGAPVWGAYLLIQVGTIILNDKMTKSRWPLAFLCVNLTAATGAAHKLSSALYCSRISSDGLSYAIGELGMICGVVLVVVMSVFVIVVKGKERR